VKCSSNEFSVFDPPSGRTCGQYLAAYLSRAPGALENPDATSSCRYCSLSNADQFVAGSNIFWSEKWRNYGIVWAFIVFNAFIAVLTYWLFRVKKWKGSSLKSSEKSVERKKETEKKEKSSHFNLFRR
jgi:ABC-type multidrug transport system permease subunit